MADAYWRYSNDGRQQQQQQQPIPSQLAKRPRTDYEIASGQDISTFYGGREDNPSAAHGVIRDTDTINASYDRYLRNSQQQQHQHQPIPSYGMESGRSMSTGLAHDDPRLLSNTVMATKAAVAGGHRENRLPPDATCTLYVEGLPANCTRREVAHIFRPFVGYKEVRLVTKESRRPGGDPLVLCFVDFQSPAHAATAMDAIQGYAFDEHERESAHLRLQFARNPGARSGPGSRSKR